MTRFRDPRTLTDAEVADLLFVLKKSVRGRPNYFKDHPDKLSVSRMERLYDRLRNAPKDVVLPEAGTTETPEEQAEKIVDQLINAPEWGYRAHFIAAIARVIGAKSP